MGCVYDFGDADIGVAGAPGARQRVLLGRRRVWGALVIVNADCMALEPWHPRQCISAITSSGHWRVLWTGSDSKYVVVVVVVVSRLAVGIGLVVNEEHRH